MATRTWLSTTTGDFAASANWSGSLVPTAGDIALFVGNAGTVTNSGTGSAGTVTVDSAGVLTVAGSLLAQTFVAIGQSGAATVTVPAGGVLKSLASTSNIQVIANGTNAIRVGNLSGSNGTLAVTGGLVDAGTYRLTVGVSGAGTVAVSNGGTVHAGFTSYSDNTSASIESAVTVGGSIGSTGVVTVTGANSTLRLDGRIVVGSIGSGSLVVSNGGTVQPTMITGFDATGGTIAQNGTTLTYYSALVVGTGGGVGNVTATGAGSLINVTGGVDIGSFGTGGVSGTVLIDQGATALSGNGAGDVGVFVGFTAGAAGVITVDHGGRWVNTNGHFIVGHNGAGTVNIFNGGTVTTTRNDAGPTTPGANIGNSLGASGAVNVVGANATWGVRDNLVVGFNGTGVLSVTSAGTVTVGTTLTLGAASGTGRVTVDATGHLEVGGAGHSAAGTILVDAGGVVNGYGTITGSLSNNGLIDAAASGKVLRLGAVSNAGTLAVEAGASLELANFVGGVLSFNGNGTFMFDTAPTANVSGTGAGVGGGTIDLVGQTGVTATVNGAGLTITEQGNPFAFTVSGVTLQPVVQPDAAGTGTNIIFACFVAGTQILTDTGEVAVEELRAGDRVVTVSGRGAALKPIVWIGTSAVDLARHAAPETVAPVRIVAGAFSPGMPHRDLVLSPDHAVRVIDDAGAALMPVHLLVNGTTIRREAWRGSVRYFHVELDRHDVLLAEGLACESYLDTGNRSAFDNEAGATMLYPEFGALSWDARACAPLLQGGARVLAARAALADYPVRAARATARP